MLDIRRNRLDYGEMLIPPTGYRIERAVGTTYSADLNTILSIPVALVYNQTLEGTIDPERFQILEAIKGIAKRVTVYHQKGRLHVPSRYNRLYAFLEEMLVPVYPDTAFTSFHPKVWVLRYAHEEKTEPDVYRLLVMSRNLTFDRSWDVAVCLEGIDTGEPQNPNRPILAFLEHLSALSAFPEAGAFLKGLGQTKFEYPEGFRYPRFHPIGIPGHLTSPIHEVSGDRAVILSPFVDDKALGTILDHVGEVHLFSRREELAKLKPETLERCASRSVISRWVVEGERRVEAEEGAAEDVRDQDLHAKLYVVEKGGAARWYLGSANATSAALTRNTEFLVEMTGRQGKGLVDDVLNDLLGKERDLRVFEDFLPDDATGEDPDAAMRNTLRQLEYTLLDVPVTASVVRSANQTNFDMTVRIDLKGLPEVTGVELAVRPLCVEGDAKKLRFGEVNDLVFENIPETELTRFLVYEIQGESTRRFLVKVDVQGMPASRGDSIFKSIVNSREKFFQYLAFLLSEDPGKAGWAEEKVPVAKGIPADGEETWMEGVPIFEQLLVAASRSPGKLRQVDELISRLRADADRDDVVVPKAFLDFWEVFRPLIPEAKGRPR